MNTLVPRHWVGIPWILMVEDDLDHAVMYRDALRHHGFDVTMAHDGRTALKVAATLAHDVVLLDLALPDVDGMQLLDDLRSDPVGAGVPVVVLSNTNDPQVMEEAYRRGAVAYYVKQDVPPMKLAGALDDMLRAS
jgi:two-component system alkaline phosphatase synthesis response regulator PhoP